MKRIEAIIRPERLGDVAQQLEDHGLAGFTIADVRGHGSSPERTGGYRGNSYELLVNHKLMITLYVDDDEVNTGVEAIFSGASTGEIGDGLITVSELSSVYRISPAPAGSAPSAAAPAAGGPTSHVG